MADETPKFDTKNVANWRKEVKAAKGDIIIWWDDDDYYSPDYVKVVVTRLTSNPNILLADIISGIWIPD